MLQKNDKCDGNWLRTNTVMAKKNAGPESCASGCKTLASKQGVLTPPATDTWVPEQSDWSQKALESHRPNPLFSQTAHRITRRPNHEAARTAQKHSFGTHARGIATLRGDATDARQHSHSLA